MKASTSNQGEGSDEREGGVGVVIIAGNMQVGNMGKEVVLVNQSIPIKFEVQKTGSL
jgi:hypothetical protein